MNDLTASKLSRRRIRNRKRILIVNCYFDYTRLSVPRPFKAPQAMAPVYLAGAFSAELCDIRMYNEQYSGPLEDEHLISWPDMLVMTGLTSAFDRMLHLTAYARTKNANVIVVAGGSPVRAIPNYSRRFFDYACCGDIEEMNEVIADAFGKDYVAQEMLPRYDLAYWTQSRRIGYAETSRNCNFRCPFCVLTGEGVGYQKYDLEYIQKQIIAMGKKKHILFLDNNFYGNNRKFFLERLELIKDMRKAGFFRDWAALVTNDFFYKDENLKLVHDAGCFGLFTGIEAFDTQWLQNNKVQNIRFPQVELIRKSLDAGVVFHYGLIMDVTTRRIADLRQELDFIISTPDITLPGYLVPPIPILGTPFFYESLAKGAILPETKLRDLDSVTLSLRPLDPIDGVADFFRNIQGLYGYRLRVLKHSLGFYKRYRSKLTNFHMLVALNSSLLLCAERLITSRSWADTKYKRARRHRNVSTRGPLDDAYKPAFCVESLYEDYFKPTMVTDKDGYLAEELAEDLLVAQKVD
ncbi:MAG: hypothetical protein SCARUB_03225 [Candidatus Scalindua rubra]|uniref:Radical SAM core domain-containing protein n=1 Tax=Candidatus Scalindua rubra TaxID=1872076 RepID=A0A1E3X7N6_9BACT|nr:MAG: hypothetical protein SCARUB_03225 [Candidatus Scalindua rubra]